MSVINKKPFIKSVLESLSDTELKSLKILMDGGAGTPIVRSLINPANAITSGDKGVSRVKLETKNKYYTGYLLFTDDYCVVVFYNDNQNLGMLDIHGTSFEVVDEYLDINELRSETDDTQESIAGGDVKIEVVNSLPVSGENNTLYLSPTNAASEGGVVIVPVPEVADAGKVLQVNNSGELELGTVSGGTKLYKHEITGVYDQFAIPINFTVISNSSTVTTSIADLYNLCKACVSWFALKSTTILTSYFGQSSGQSGATYTLINMMDLGGGSVGSQILTLSLNPTTPAYSDTVTEL